MSPSFEQEAPDHFSAGAVGPPGQRIFYLQGRESGTVVTLKCEKEQVAALGEYLAGLLAKLPGTAPPAADAGDLIQPTEAAWAVGAIGIGYDQARDRILVEATELQEEEEEGGPEAAEEAGATARFLITRAQAAGFVAQAHVLMQSSRPLCPFCTRPIDPGGHVCPRSNGHVVH